jgi:transposase-like protein
MPEEQERKRRAYDEAFKRDAVALMLKGDRTVMQLADDLGVSVES